MTRIISVANQKGGVGKTTTSVNLAAYLASFGNSVLLVDIDPQGNASSGMGIDVKKIGRGIYEAIAGQAQVEDILHAAEVDGLHIAPATMNLAGANVELVNISDREFRLHNALKNVHDRFDYIIIDCPPSLGLLTINGIVASTEILIPVQTEYYALEGLSQLLSTIELIRENLKQDIAILGVVMTMYDERYRLSNAVFHELHKSFPNKVFRIVVPRNVRLAEAPSHGKSVMQYDAGSPGAAAYRRLAQEIHMTKAKQYE
ncbi:ParA family protein [Patescibacteria group bacterium]